MPCKLDPTNDLLVQEIPNGLNPNLIPKLRFQDLVLDFAAFEFSCIQIEVLDCIVTWWSGPMFSERDSKKKERKKELETQNQLTYIAWLGAVLETGVWALEPQVGRHGRLFGQLWPDNPERRSHDPECTNRQSINIFRSWGKAGQDRQKETNIAAAG